MAFLPISYWVEPGRLLAGEHPGFASARVLPGIRALVEAGVDAFVDLTQEDDHDRYEHLLANGAWAPRSAPDYRRMPIVDMSVPSREEMMSTLDVIDGMLHSGRTVYVHCLAGLGRTGTVVGCRLARHGREGDLALRELARLREGMIGDSPQTEEQRRFVREWRAGW